MIWINDFCVIFFCSVLIGTWGSPKSRETVSFKEEYRFENQSQMIKRWKTTLWLIKSNHYYFSSLYGCRENLWLLCIDFETMLHVTTKNFSLFNSIIVKQSLNFSWRFRPPNFAVACETLQATRASGCIRRLILLLWGTNVAKCVAKQIWNSSWSYM